MLGIMNRRIKLTNIDGLGNFNKDLIGMVVSQSDRNHCIIKLDEELIFDNKRILELNISTRHQGKNLDNIISRGLRKFLNIPSVIAVSAVDKDNSISFIAEIILAEPL